MRILQVRNNCFGVVWTRVASGIVPETQNLNAEDAGNP